MLRKSQSSQRPEKVTIEAMPDGAKNIRLTANVEKLKDDEGNIYHRYDEVEFTFPTDRRATKTTLTENFDAWWEYGSHDSEAITLEERIEALEELVLSLLGGDEP